MAVEIPTSLPCEANCPLGRFCGRMYKRGDCKEKVDQFFNEYVPQHGTVFPGGFAIQTHEASSGKTLTITAGAVRVS